MGGLPGAIVVLSGPAGVGKSTVGEKLIARGGITRAVTATTRAPRGSEREGVDYYFLTRAQFEADLVQGRFLEHAEVHGNLYGTPLRPVAQVLRSGKSVLLIIDVDGAEQVRNLGLDALSVFLLPPSRDELIARLRGRGTEDEEKLSRRISRVDRELEAAKRYDARVVNGELGVCVDEVVALVTRHRKALAEKLARGETLYPGLAKLGM